VARLIVIPARARTGGPILGRRLPGARARARAGGAGPAEELEHALVQGVDVRDGLKEGIGDVVPDLRLVVARGREAAEDDADLRRQRGARDRQQGDERRGVRGRHGHVGERRHDDGEDDVGLRAHDLCERREGRGRALVVERVEELVELRQYYVHTAVLPLTAPSVTLRRETAIYNNHNICV